MATGNDEAVVGQLFTLFRVGKTGDLSDGQLLERFSNGRGEEAELAFAALVDRHGPLVLRICRAVLADVHDAQDAFQATFLILVKKARTLWVRETIAPWLYRVAYRAATRAKSDALRRRHHERCAVQRAADAPILSGDGYHHEQTQMLHEEINRLPERYRIPVVLCDLEGYTHEQAARSLKWPVGTVKSRQARGREQLRGRLTRRGLAPSAVPMGLLCVGDAKAVVPAAWRETIIRAAPAVANHATTAGVVSTAVGELTRGVLKAMVFDKLRMVMVAVTACLALVTGAGVAAWQIATPPAQGEPRRQEAGQQAKVVKGGTDTAHSSVTERDDPSPAQKDILNATETLRLALSAHAQAAAIDKLPRFSYQVRYRHGIVDSMRAIDPSLDRFRQGLTAPVLEKDWVGWYQTSFSWDEKRFLWEMRPGDTALNYASEFWTKTDAWERREANDKSSVDFVRSAGPTKFWKHMNLFDYSYLRVTPHRYWWGQTAADNLQTMSLVPPEKASWRHLGVAKFGGELCDVVDSTQRTERLWIGRDSGRVRGALSYRVAPDPARSRTFYEADTVRRIAGRTFFTPGEYTNWMYGEATEDQSIQVALAWTELYPRTPPADIEPNELVLFDDYREVAPGVWLPFHEVRTFPHASETVQGKRLLRRSELCVEGIRTDVDLADRFARLLPKEGERVQDQRFMVPIDYEYRANLADDEIRQRAEAEYSKRLEGQKILKRLTQPVEAMVGKPAPRLPAAGWIGGQPPDLTGKPYLLHFWATWCGPCKNDLPRLKALAERGVIILGMHPPGTPPEEVEKAVLEQHLGHPTFLATGKDSDASNARIGGYPAGVFPYYIQVDAKGRVAGHGSLSEILGR